MGEAARGWRSTCVARFISEFNRDSEGIETPAGLLPERGRRGLFLSAIGLTLVALAVRAPLLGKAYVAPDTSAYLAVAEHIFHGGFLDNLRPPAYSLLLAVFEELGTNPVTAAVYLQNVAGIFLPAAVLLIAWRFFSAPVGVIAGFLTAASPLMIVTEQIGLAEFLFGVLLLAATALLVEAAWRIQARQMPWKLLAATGAMFGIATLFRANGLLALVAIPVVLWIAAGKWRPGLRASAVAIGVMLAVLAPWCIHNLIRFGNPNVATVENISLYARAVTWDRVPPSPDTADGRLALDLYNQEAPPTALFNALIGEGRTSSEATEVMGALASEAVLQHPDIYLNDTWYGLGEYRRLFDSKTFTADQGRDQIAATRYYFEALRRSDDRGSIPTTELAARSLPGDSPLTRVPWQIAQTLTHLLYLISLGGILIFLLLFAGGSRQRLAALVLVLVVALGVLGSSLSSVFSPRYDIVFAPMVWLLLAATAIRIVELIAAAIARRRGATAGG